MPDQKKTVLSRPVRDFHYSLKTDHDTAAPDAPLCNEVDISGLIAGDSKVITMAFRFHARWEDIAQTVRENLGEVQMQEPYQPQYGYPFATLYFTGHTIDNLNGRLKQVFSAAAPVSRLLVPEELFEAAMEHTDKVMDELKEASASRQWFSGLGLTVSR